MRVTVSSGPQITLETTDALEGGDVFVSVQSTGALPESLFYRWQLASDASGLSDGVAGGFPIRLPPAESSRELRFPTAYRSGPQPTQAANFVLELVPIERDGDDVAQGAPREGEPIPIVRSNARIFDTPTVQMRNVGGAPGHPMVLLATIDREDGFDLPIEYEIAISGTNSVINDPPRSLVFGEGEDLQPIVLQTNDSPGLFGEQRFSLNLERNGERFGGAEGTVPFPSRPEDPETNWPLLLGIGGLSGLLGFGLAKAISSSGTGDYFDEKPEPPTVVPEVALRDCEAFPPKLVGEPPGVEGPTISLSTRLAAGEFAESSARPVRPEESENG